MCVCHTDRHTTIKFKVNLCFSLPIYIFIVFHLADHVADFWIAVNFLHQIAWSLDKWLEIYLEEFHLNRFLILFSSYIYIYIYI